MYAQVSPDVVAGGESAGGGGDTGAVVDGHIPPPSPPAGVGSHSAAAEGDLSIQRPSSSVEEAAL